MKDAIISDSAKTTRLRMIDYSDIENLREWKNTNTQSFFYKNKITSKEQIQWYEAYCQRENDYMFMVEALTENGWISIGCMGYRVIGAEIDIYNVIRGMPAVSRGSMGIAMGMMIDYIFHEYSCRVKCDVLANNPAVVWYADCGFVIESKIDDYYVMSYSSNDC